MVAIKRYPNRKLYNTQTREYISLDGLADLICAGDEIVVTDNASGEDLTALTLTQIILTQEKKQNGVLPHSALTSLIRAGGDRLSALQRGLLAPLGLWGQVDEEIKLRVQALVAAGELGEVEGSELIEKLIAAGHKIRAQVRAQLRAQVRPEKAPKEAAHQPEVKGTSFAEVEAQVRKRQLPSQQDVRRLEQQLAELEAKLEEITQARGKAG